MPKLILRFDDRELAECAVGIHPVTIGRLPDNVMVIDNPAVSARHARVYKEGHEYVLEDLKSTNGTFVNDKPIARHTLLDGDRILVARHTLVFMQEGSELGDDHADAVTQLPEIGGPMTLDVPGRRLAANDAIAPKTAIPTAQGRIGTIKVVSGYTGQREYLLSAVTTIIGKAETAQIKTSGWFKPQHAAAIARKGEGFTVTPMSAKVKVNGEPISGRRDLASGDLIEVSDVTLEFTLS